jgi:hypothetical protein
VPIISNRPKVIASTQPSARLQQVYTIKAGFQAQVPANLTRTPPTSLYLLDPVHVCEDIQEARTLLDSKDDQHYAHFMNVGKNIDKLPPDIILARVMAVKDSTPAAAISNVTNKESPADLQAFEEALQEVGINIELKHEEK